ncbi:MAG: hypothetical protein ACJ79J_14210 [Gemmatimonadaceae bacterium]
MRFITQTTRLFMLAAFTACASSGSGGSSSGSQDSISRAEIYNSSTSNAYELISRLRPQWLRSPASGAISTGLPRNQVVLVYLDRQRLEDLDALKTVSVEGIDSARWVDAARVQTIMSDVPAVPIAGAILLKTRK